MSLIQRFIRQGDARSTRRVADPVCETAFYVYLLERYAVAEEHNVRALRSEYRASLLETTEHAIREKRASISKDSLRLRALKRLFKRHGAIHGRPVAKMSHTELTTALAAARADFSMASQYREFVRHARET